METMKPGRELDTLVAERVMGLRSTLSDAKDQREYESGRRKIELCPEYSTDIAAAWEVVTKTKIESVIHLEDGRWVAKFVSDYFASTEGDDKPAWPRINEYYETSLYEDSVLIGETAPHAICLAALKAIEPYVSVNGVRVGHIEP